MIKRIIIFILLLYLIQMKLYTIDIKKYNPKKVVTLPQGNNNGQIGLNKKFIGGATGPMSLYIKNNGNFYVSDGINNRIVILDKNGKFISNIYNHGRYNLLGSYKIEIDNNDNIFILSSGYMKIDKNGEALFYIDFNKIDNNLFNKNNFFLINDYTIFYDSTNSLKIFNNKGEIVLKNLKNDLVNAINNKSLQKIDPNKTEKIKSFLSKNELIFNENKLLTKNFEQFKEYSYLKNSKIDFQNLSNISVGEFINYDNEYNSYWNGYEKYPNKIIIIFDNEGNIKHCFYNILIENILSIDQNGNCYTIIPDENNENITIWKYEKAW